MAFDELNQDLAALAHAAVEKVLPLPFALMNCVFLQEDLGSIEMLKIKSLDIQNIGRIEQLKLSFGPGLNLICGPNGIGKTTILEVIGHTFSRSHRIILRKRVGVQSGGYTLTAQRGQAEQSFKGTCEKFEPHEGEQTQGRDDCLGWVIVLKTNRTFDYIQLPAVNRDPTDQNRGRELGMRGIQFNDVKNWFVNRFMFSAHPGNLSAEQLSNLDLAKRSFNELDGSVSFAKVRSDTFDILVKTPDGEIPFEYLSAGFKSCTCLVIGIIKEIEYRFKNPYVVAELFEGVVVIDELDLHLHPEWQSQLIRLLKKIFPKTQFIAATHSPHMIQAAEPNEIIALQSDSSGRVVQRELPNSEFGFQGWTVEEILTDVMGMSDTRSAKYGELERDFEAAVKDGDHRRAEQIFKVFDRFLHPNNVQRKLFKLQLGLVAGGEK